MGNVTGSNAVNVFLGMGLPWVISAVYWRVNYDMPSYVPSGDLAFSVIVFLSCSMGCFLILLLRRLFIGGELGGPPLSRCASAVCLVSLWIVYLVLCTMRAYGVSFEVPITMGGESIVTPSN